MRGYNYPTGIKVRVHNDGEIHMTAGENRRGGVKIAAKIYEVLLNIERDGGLKLPCTIRVEAI